MIVILEKKMVDAMLEIDKEIYGEYVIYGEKGKKIHVRLPQQGDVWNNKVRTSVLHKMVKRAARIWVRNKPI